MFWRVSTKRVVEKPNPRVSPVVFLEVVENARPVCEVLYAEVVEKDLARY